MGDQKILIVEDEPKILEVIESYFLNEGYGVVKAEDGQTGLELFYSEAPVLIILDLMLPDISGEEICRELRKVSNVPIIMLTAKSEEQSIVSGLDIGADDYITKPFSPRQLVARVKALLRRAHNNFDEKVSFNQGKLIIDFNEHNAVVNGKDTALTPAEFKLLGSLANNPAKVFSRDELVNLVLGFDYDGFDRTIDVHIKNLRGKIEVYSKKPEYILTVFGVGYKFGGKADA